MHEREILREQWRSVAEALSLEFIGPFYLSLPEGRRSEFAGLLPQFGGKRGMLIDCEHDQEEAFAAAIAAGFGYSVMRAEHHNLPVEPTDYLDCLRDWGWSVEGQTPPEWYASAA
jgi:hypothetical protein